jgi:ribosomal protein S18 acetylase RimI-like enzyme
MSIRPATVEDARGIAEVHVSSWHSTYTGLVPQDSIAVRTVERRLAFWSQMLSRPEGPTATFVSVDDKTGKIVGFAQASHGNNHLPGYDGEITSLYLLESHQRQGRGRQLVHASAIHLQSMGCQTVMLWVLVGNDSALAFYKSLGGVIVNERVEKLVDAELHEYAIGWTSVEMLKLTTL